MPPDNAGYAVAAYIVAAVILQGDTGAVLRRAKRANRRARRGRSSARVNGPSTRSSRAAFADCPAYGSFRFGSSTCSQSSPATTPPRIGPIQ
jgi:hypothetical protein